MPTNGKTTTILGRYDMDTQYIFEETGNIKSLSYDGHKGATEPNQVSMYRRNKGTGLVELSGFGREIKYLEGKGYIWDKGLMQMVPSR